ncbi:MAG: hypothetical protein RLZZ196_1185, partial [Bacteroidota bacterium]
KNQKIALPDAPPKRYLFERKISNTKLDLLNIK